MGAKMQGMRSGDVFMRTHEGRTPGNVQSSTLDWWITGSMRVGGGNRRQGAGGQEMKSELRTVFLCVVDAHGATQKVDGFNVNEAELVHFGFDAELGGIGF